MKILLHVILLTGLIYISPVSMSAQGCTFCEVDTAACPPPSPLDGLSTFICGDTVFSAMIGDAVDETVTFLLPDQFVVKANNPIPGLPPQFIFPFDINIDVFRFQITGVSGLPPGFTWVCGDTAAQQNNCTYIPTSNARTGCVRFCGTLGCTQIDTFSILVNYTFAQNVDLSGFPIPVPVDSVVNDGSYTILLAIDQSGVSILEITANKPSTIQLGESIQLTATPGFSNYDWSVSNSTMNVISFTPDSSVTVSVATTDINGCEQSSTFDITVLGESDTTGILDQATKYTILAFPNPAKTVVHITSYGETSILGIEVYDLAGKEVGFITDKDISSHDNTLTFAPELKGLFLLNIQTSEGVLNQKILLE